MELKIRLSSPYLMANSVPRVKFCQPFRSAVCVRICPTSYPTLTPPLVSLSPLPKQMYVFTKDLEQLAADLRTVDDKAAVVQRYEDALAAKSQVRCQIASFLSGRSHES